MSELFAHLRKVTVVQYKPHVLLHHAQPFSSPIHVRVENSKQAGSVVEQVGIAQIFGQFPFILPWIPTFPTELVILAGVPSVPQPLSGFNGRRVPADGEKSTV